jgi:fluoride exporter
MTTVLLIALGAAIGAPTRFIIDRYLNGAWPRGTLLVNLLGSLIFGVVAGYSLGATESRNVLLAFIGIGFCGSLTTFGGFAAQTVDLLQLGRSDTSRSSVAGVLYATGSLVGCIVVAWIGLITALRIWPGV